MLERLNLFDLRLLTHIAEGNSLTHGAARSNISVPAASSRMRNLEAVMGVQLLYRSSQGVALTPAGETFLRHARLMLRQLEQLHGDMREFARGVKGHVRVVATTTAISEFLPQVVGEYVALWPEINVELQERLGDDIVSSLREGSADLGILSSNVQTAGLEVLPYRAHRLVVVTARNHPLAHRRSIRFEETLAFGYVGLPANSSFQQFLVQAATALGKDLNIRIRVNNFEAASRMIAMDVGIGLFPEPAAERFAKTMDIRVVRLTDSWSTRHLAICARSFKLLPSFVASLVELLSADAGNQRRR